RRRREDGRDAGRGRDRQGGDGPGLARGRRAAAGGGGRGADGTGGERGGRHRGAGGGSRSGTSDCSQAGTSAGPRERGAGSGTLHRSAARRYASEGLPAAETDREARGGRPHAGDRDRSGRARDEPGTASSA